MSASARAPSSHLGSPRPFHHSFSVSLLWCPFIFRLPPIHPQRPASSSPLSFWGFKHPARFCTCAPMLPPPPPLGPTLYFISPSCRPPLLDLAHFARLFLFLFFFTFVWTRLVSFYRGFSLETFPRCTPVNDRSLTGSSKLSTSNCLQSTVRNGFYQISARSKPLSAQFIW